MCKEIAGKNTMICLRLDWALWGLDPLPAEVSLRVSGAP